MENTHNLFHSYTEEAQRLQEENERLSSAVDAERQMANNALRAYAKSQNEVEELKKAHLFSNINVRCILKDLIRFTHDLGADFDIDMENVYDELEADADKSETEDESVTDSDESLNLDSLAINMPDYKDIIDQQIQPEKPYAISMTMEEIKQINPPYQFKDMSSIWDIEILPPLGTYEYEKVKS